MIGLKGIRIFPKAAVSTASVGTAVSASFDSSTGAVTISSTSGVGTINKDSLINFWNTCGKGNIKTITFKNSVYAPQDSYRLFRELTNLTSINANYLNVSNVTNMADIFLGCTNLITVGDLSNWNTSKVINMGYIFYNCTNLTTVGNLSKWNTYNVTSMCNMFLGCRQLVTVGDLSNWNVSNVTDMKSIFSGCYNLSSVGELSNWNTSNVTDMQRMFFECEKLTTVGDLSNWNTSKVTNMAYMFHYCYNLSTVGDLGNWNTSNVTDMQRMFSNCRSLTELNLRNWNMSKVADTTNMLNTCALLEDIYTPKILPSGISIELPNGYRDYDKIPEEIDIIYNSIDESNTKFSKSVHLSKIVVIYFNLDMGENYKLAEYDSVLQPKIYKLSEIKAIDNASGTGGYGLDLLPVTKDGKSILWDEDRIESETEYKFIGWRNSNDDSLCDVPYVSNYFYDDVVYTAAFQEKMPKYDLELTHMGEKTGKLLQNTCYRIEGAGREEVNQKEYETDENGKLIIEDLYENEEYVLTEKSSTLGYKVKEEPVRFKAIINEKGRWELEVTSGSFLGEPIIEDSTIKVKWEDEILLKVEKVDDETGKVLQGAKFTVKDSTGNYAKDINGNEIGTIETINGEEMRVITTEEDGLAVAEVLPGTYQVEEVQAPFGYDLSLNTVQNLEIKVVQKEKLGIEEKWATKFASNTGDVIERVVLTQDGGRIFAGSIGSISTEGNKFEGGNNLVVKYNKEGRRVWGVDFKYGYPNTVLETKDNGLLVLGKTGMVRYAKSGEGYEEVWESTILTSTGSIDFRYISETSDGGFVLTGWMGVNITLKDSSTSTTLTKKGTRDIFIIKYKKSGDNYVVEWSTNMATSTNGTDVTSLIETEDKGILIGGAVQGSLTLPDNTTLTNTKTNVDNTFLIKFDKNPTEAGYTYNWGRRVTGERNRVTGVAETTDGEYVIGGLFSGTVTMPNSTNLVSNGLLDNIIIRFDKNGNVKYGFNIGGTGNEFTNQVSATNDGGFVIAGSIASNVTLGNGQEIKTNGDRDALVVRFDKDGNVVWATSYGGSAVDYFTCVNVNDDNEVLLGTYFVSESLTLNNGDVLEGVSGNTDAALIHLKEIILQQEIIQTQKLVFEDSKKLYNITTEVEGIGGTISGEGQVFYEQVKYSEDSQKDIVITPIDEYAVASVTVNGEEIEFTYNDDGTVTLNKFTNVQEDKHIVVKFNFAAPIISQTKEATTQYGKEYAIEGEIVTYTIIVKNSGTLAKDVIIKDSIPIGTTFIDGSIKINDVVNSELGIDNLTLNGITVMAPIRGEVRLSFDVIVDELEEGIYFKQLKNIATVDGVDTNEEVVNVNKSSIIFDKKVSPEGNVKEGQELTYNIMVSNIGSIADIVQIYDAIPENTTYVSDSIKLGDKTYTDEELTGDNILRDEMYIDEGLTEDEIYTGEENLEKETITITKIGENVTDILVRNMEVNPGEEITLSFKVIVNSNLENGTKIINKAFVNEKPTVPVENTVVKPIIEVIKEAEEKYIFRGDEVTYNIKAVNTGDLGGYVTVKDIISDKVLLEAESIIINGSSSYKTSTGEIIDLKGKTAIDLANGIEVYVPERQNEKAGETIISFNVKVKEDAVIGDVLNKATWIEKDKTEEHETEIVKIPVIVFEKTSKVIRKTTETQELPEGKVTANDEIEYTITVINTGTADSNSFTITDTIPENTNLIDEINFHDEYLTNGELQGNELTWLIDELKAGQSVDVKFSVVVKYNKVETLEIKNTAYVNEIPTNEIVTEYKKPTPKLTTGVSKSGDGTAIVGNGISYTIAYTGEIKDFVGKANVVIVDQLPYEIDEVKSKLDNGIYDSETKTITWEIPVESIDTYTTKKSNEIAITKELLLYYDTQLIEQDIENKVTARTEIIELPEEKVVDTDEVSASHIVKIRKLRELPLTGGMGTVVFTAIGVAFIVVGAVWLITISKKRNC